MKKISVGFLVFNENDKKYFKSYNLNYLKINYSKILETITH